jgi:hypothetical protein
MKLTDLLQLEVKRLLHGVVKISNFRNIDNNFHLLNIPHYELYIL